MPKQKSYTPNTRVLTCACLHPFQDERYGVNLRVHNARRKPRPGWRWSAGRSRPSAWANRATSPTPRPWPGATTPNAPTSRPPCSRAGAWSSASVSIPSAASSKIATCERLSSASALITDQMWGIYYKPDFLREVWADYLARLEQAGLSRRPN